MSLRPLFSRGGCLLALLLASCAPLGYAYPTLSGTPRIPTNAPADEVYAFRVDETNEELSRTYPSFIKQTGSWTVITRTKLGLVRPDKKGHVSEQTQATLTNARIWYNLVGVKDQDFTSRRVLVRLYRAGWRTIEIGPGPTTEPFYWEGADGSAAQERAIDVLLGGGPMMSDETGPAERVPGADDLAQASKVTTRDSSLWLHVLAPGSESAEHQDALLFAASEYDRLAGLCAKSEPVQTERLRNKAKTLRELAAR